jgi:hypothetical protein
MATEKTIFLWAVCGLLISLTFAEPIRGQDLSPAQNQEYLDAKTSIEAARAAQAEKYSAEIMKKAGDFLEEAERVRSLKDGVQFTQASHLARVYAELAKATAELKREEENLAVTSDKLRKVKAEIERLKKE